MKRILCTTWGVIAVLVAGCRREVPPQPSQEVFAPVGLVNVDGTPLLREELEEELARRTARRDDADFDAVLEEAVQRQRLVAEARRIGLDREPATRRAMEGVLIARLKELQLEPRYAGSQGASNTAPVPQDPLPGGPVSGQLSRVAWLRLRFNPRSSAERRDAVRERMNEARAQALALGPDVEGFGSLAIDYSDDDDSRGAGGDLGWLPDSGTMLPGGEAVARALADLRTAGEISPVIEGWDAFHLLRLMERRTVAAGEPDSRREVAVTSHRARIERRRAIEREYFEELKTRIPAEYQTPAIEEARAAWRSVRSTTETVGPGAPGGGPP